jgi:hypothetical protein
MTRVVARRSYLEVGLISAALTFARTEASVMRGKTKELWEQFCEQAAVEQDPERLVQLAKEINRMLEEKEQRLKQNDGRRSKNFP